MITCSKLGYLGQLGNQMFQYAALLGVAAKTGYEIQIPKRYDRVKTDGLVELEPFRISAQELIIPLNNFHEFQEPSYLFNPSIFEQPDNTDYIGLFQTDKYFVHAAQKVREEFRFKDGFEQYARLFVQQKRVTDCVVCIHVRRGDRLLFTNTNPLLTPEYYYRAINHPALPQNKQFLIFSDDMPWCRENIVPLARDKMICVDSPSHWHDLAIMTFCDAYIIASSSFSWWGAWLCHNQPNVVIAPTPWFVIKKDILYWEDIDLIPSHWIKQQNEI
jgi:hypothetical protein